MAHKLELVSLLVARPHYEQRCCNQRKQCAKPSHLTELDILFSVLAILDACIGIIGSGYNVTPINPRFVTSHDTFEQI